MKKKIKNYLIIKISFLFLIFLIFNFLIFFSKHLGFRSLQQELVNHQISKIKIDQKIVFLGDSSLGHGINAQLWSKLSGEKTSNLALTGNFSFAGAYAMLDEIIKRNKKLETVVIMSNVYSWQENIKFSGYDYIKDQKNVFLKYLNYIDKNIFPIKSFYFDLLFKKKSENYSNLITNDFMKHGRKINKDTKVYFNLESFNDKKSFFLKKIINYCKRFNIECIYFHGPLYEKSCIFENAKFFSRINKELEDIDIPHFEKIECLNFDQISDTIYHPSANTKNYLTKKYFEKYMKIKKIK
jgi:hypothetical protein